MDAVRQEHADLDDLSECAAGCLQHRLTVEERLPRLLLNRRAGQVPRARVDSNQARDVDVVTGSYALAVQR